MTSITESALAAQLRALHERYAIPQLGPGEFTVAQYAAACAITPNRAMALLEVMEQNKAVVCVGDRMAHNRKARAYRLA